jgi:hypothetical protein
MIPNPPFMKKTSPLLALALIAFLFTTSFAQTVNQTLITEPVKYNDFIVEQQNLIGDKLLQLIQVFQDAQSTKDEATASLELVNGAIGLALSNLSGLSPIEDHGLKQKATDLFLFYQRTMQSKYPLLINQVYSESPDQEEINRILTEVTAEEKGYDDSFQEAQTNFAAANNFSLEENRLQKEINKE